jgi:pilus assembly protein Flp/PilA
MTQLKNLLSNMKRNQKGQAMVEYALIIGLIAVVVIGTLVILGDKLDGIFKSIVTNLSPSSGS